MGTQKWRRRNIRQAITVLAIVIGLLIGYQFYLENKNKVVVYFRLPDGKETPRYKVEVALDAAARAKGLMYRKELPSDSGMLFIFPEDQKLRFWMKNTYLPLDMIFMDSEYKVVGVFSNTTPLSEESVGPDVVSRYVLELNGGVAEASGILVNSKMLYGKGTNPSG